MYYGFAYNSQLNTISLPKLKTIGSYGLAYVYMGCTGLESVSLDSIQDLGASALQYAFYYCTNLSYKSTQAQMNSAKKKLDSELEKFETIRKTFNDTSENDKNFSKISSEFDNQVKKVKSARLNSDMKSHIHYLALNEKRNIRKK